MVNKSLISKIFAAIKKTPSEISAYEDMFAVCRDIESDNFELAHKTNAELRNKIAVAMRDGNSTGEFFSLYKRTLLFDAPHDFDSYLLYLEMNRKPADRFYQPRRKVLKRVVEKLQALVDDELDELFLSMPPRVGKSTLLIFFETWVMGRDMEHPSLYCSYSDVITRAFYNGVLEIMTDKDTYSYNDVFPDAKISRTNAQDEIIDVGRKKHYPSLTCRSLYGTLNGACDAENGFIISDDLIGGIEEALNPDRLTTAWGKVDNNLIPRGKGKTKYLWVGTRWSIADPTGRRYHLLQTDDKFKDYRYEFINLPALDDNDESNFCYDYNVGFDSIYYQRRRASFERNDDMASWNAQYMGTPIEREGTLFKPDDMRYYNGVLPDGAPDCVFIAVDPAWGGGDYVAAPICYQYGDDIFVHDVVFDNGDKKITEPLIVDGIIRNKVTRGRIEATKATESYKEDIDSRLKKKGYKMNLTSKAAGTNISKNQRIFDKSPEIRENMIFRESGKRSKAYVLFMQNVFAFKLLGTNKHDDAPDSLAMAIDMITNPMGQYAIFRRQF